MNRTPLNAIALNGNIHVQIGGSAAVEFSAELPLVVGNMLSGSAEIQVGGSLNLYTGLMLAGSASVEVNATGGVGISDKIDLAGEADIEFSVDVARHGNPAIPSVYHPAHRSWSMEVPGDDPWRMVVPEDPDLVARPDDRVIRVAPDRWRQS